jgi:hypothetical protein
MSRPWRPRGIGAPQGHNHGDLPVDQIGGQRGQPVIMAFRPAVFDREIPPLEIACFAETLAEGIDELPQIAGRSAVKKSDHGHGGLLRA